MGLLPLFLWAQARVGAAAPALLWGGVRAGLWGIRSLDGRGLALDPLAWQWLCRIGAWWGWRRARGAPPLPARPWAVEVRPGTISP
jgi:hypothetical protein